MAQPQTPMASGKAAADADRLEQLATQLALLGAESQTERNVKRIVPWFVSLAMHVGVCLLALFMTWTVTKLPSKQDSVLIVADFNALNYGPAGSNAKGQSTSDNTAAPAPNALDPAQAIAAEPLTDLIQQRLSESSAEPLKFDAAMGSP